jgi:HemY protein
VADQPQARFCALMAQVEDAQGDKGRAREWLARALNAPRDPMWVSDGVVVQRWTPISPVTGQIVDCEWKPPFAMLPGDVDLVPETPLMPATTRPVLRPETMALPRAPDDPGVENQS